MKKFFKLPIAWLCVVMMAPLVASAGASNNKEISYDAVANTKSGWLFESAFDKDLSAKSMIKKTEPSYESFQAASNDDSKWSKLSKRFERDSDDQYDGKRTNSINKWLDDDKRGDKYSFDDKVYNENKWKSGKSWDDDKWGREKGRDHDWEYNDWKYPRCPQPVPEPGTYMMLVLGLIGFSVLQRRKS